MSVIESGCGVLTLQHRLLGRLRFRRSRDRLRTRRCRERSAGSAVDFFFEDHSKLLDGTEPVLEGVVGCAEVERGGLEVWLGAGGDHTRDDTLPGFGATPVGSVLGHDDGVVGLCLMSMV